VGRIDRIDALPGGGRMVIDYKTSSNTRDRMRVPLEDTQLAFYAALLDGDAAQAAYLQLGERKKVEVVPHPDLEAARQQLEAGLYDDIQRIAGGAPLPALGEGRACEFCAARGLCRKDSWA
jgi:ATP-dependent helicase/nuclease subunit B